MKKGLLLLADGFEQTEAIATHDILLRSHGIEVLPVSISSSYEVTSSMGLKIEVPARLMDIKDVLSYDFIVLPGGKVGVDNLGASALVRQTITKFHDAGKVIGAICAAPSILGEMGYLDGKHFTCFPGFQQGNGIYENTGSVIDGNLVTGHSMAYSIPFAENLVRVLVGESGVERLKGGAYSI